MFVVLGLAVFTALGIAVLSPYGPYDAYGLWMWGNAFNA